MKHVKIALALALGVLALGGCAVYTPYEPYPVASAPVVVAPAPVVGVYGGWGGRGGWSHRHYH